MCESWVTLVYDVQRAFLEDRLCLSRPSFWLLRRTMELLRREEGSPTSYVLRQSKQLQFCLMKADVINRFSGKGSELTGSK